MAFDKSSNERVGTGTAFKGSLARTVVIGLVVLALLPAVLVAVTTFYRSRSLLADQANAQLKSIVDRNSLQLVDITTGMNSYMDDLVFDDQVRKGINDTLADPSNETNRTLGAAILSANLQGHANTSGTNIDQVMVVDTQGKILFSTNASWENMDISKTTGIKALVGKNSSLATYNPDPLYPSQWVIFNARSFLDVGSQPMATILI